MIPDTISKQNIEDAINQILNEGIPKERISDIYFLSVDGKDIPTKYLISLAYKFVTGEELKSQEFNSIQANAYLKKLGFKIKEIVDKKNEFKKIKLYDIHGQALINYKTLITPDSKYFFWDNKPFKKYEVGDIVFWVNRSEKVALFTEVDIKVVKQTYKDGRNYIENNGYSVYAVAQNADKYETFMRFKIIEKKEIPVDWGYENPATFKNQLMAFILYERGVDNITQRISKLNDLQTLFKGNDQATQLITQAIESLSQNGEKEKKNKTRSLEKNITTNNTMFKILNAAKTKPFILLAGLSGTGKSRLVRTLAYRSCSKTELQDPQKPGNFELIPIRPNWHDSSELIGYVTRINQEKYISTTFLKFIAKAWKNLDTPFFLCLDEMNLAPVEQYFAEYLSIIESRVNHDGKIRTDYLISKLGFENTKLYKALLSDLELDEKDFNDGISLPPNLVVIGTVNMDETTHSFSRKVLDRAMTFEMNEIDLWLGLDKNQNDWAYPEQFLSLNEVIGNYTSGYEVFDQYPESKEVIKYLEKVNTALNNTPFKIAYRVRDEFLIYCYYSSLDDKKAKAWLQKSLDEMTSMKILSRIEGDENKIGNILTDLKSIMNENFITSITKLDEMQLRLTKSGYTSYWP